jgi:hypothetical protein
MPTHSKKTTDPEKTKDPDKTFWGFVAEKIIIPILVALISAGAVIGAVKISSDSPSSSSTSTPTATVSTPTPTIPPVSLSTPATNVSNLAPVILKIEPQISESWNADVVVGFDIYYYDLDGDSYAVKYNVTNSPIPDLAFSDAPITSTSSTQVAGTIETLTGFDCKTTWSRFFTGYTIMVSATIIDKAGNQSNAFPFKINCSGWW